LACLALGFFQELGTHSHPDGVAQECSLAPTPDKGYLVANIKSQIKRNKTNVKATDRNRAVRSEVKTSVRQAREAIKVGDKSLAANAVTLASRKLDKAVSKGVVHKNNAANRKSALAKQAAAL
jgi:small subunit ribosomal protein S20